MNLLCALQQLPNSNWSRRLLPVSAAAQLQALVRRTGQSRTHGSDQTKQLFLAAASIGVVCSTSGSDSDEQALDWLKSLESDETNYINDAPIGTGVTPNEY